MFEDDDGQRRDLGLIMDVNAQRIFLAIIVLKIGEVYSHFQWLNTRDCRDVIEQMSHFVHLRKNSRRKSFLDRCA